MLFTDNGNIDTDVRIYLNKSEFLWQENFFHKYYRPNKKKKHFKNVCVYIF